MDLDLIPPAIISFSNRVAFSEQKVVALQAQETPTTDAASTNMTLVNIYMKSSTVSSRHQNHREHK